MTTDLVSILIPVYNRENYIEATIKSALAQSHKNIEIVVIDNASTDRSWDIILQIAKSDRRVLIHRNAQNIGPVRNWIACADRAKGYYAKILWSDDLIAETFLAKTLPLFEPDVAFVYSSAKIFYEAGDGKTHYSRDNSGTFAAQEFIDAALFGWDVPYSPGCAVFRTADLQCCLRADIPNRIGSDFSNHAIGNDLLLMLLVADKYSKIGFINEPLSLFRHHANSISASAQRGKLALHYDVVKAYFAETRKLDACRRKRLNSALVIDLLRYRNNDWGLNSIADFYRSEGLNEIDRPFLITRLLKGFCRSLRRVGV